MCCVWSAKYENWESVLNIFGLSGKPRHLLKGIRPTLEQEKRLLKDIRQGNKAAKDAAVLYLYRGLVEAAASKYGYTGDMRQELIHEGAYFLERRIILHSQKEKNYRFSYYFWISLLRRMRKHRKKYFWGPASLDGQQGDDDVSLKDIVSDKNLPSQNTGTDTALLETAIDTQKWLEILEKNGISGRDREVYRLRLEGNTYEGIGILKGFSHGNAAYIVKKCNDILRKYFQQHKSGDTILNSPYGSVSGNSAGSPEEIQVSRPGPNSVQETDSNLDKVNLLKDILIRSFKLNSPEQGSSPLEGVTVNIREGAYLAASSILGSTNLQNSFGRIDLAWINTTFPPSLRIFPANSILALVNSG